MLQSLVSSSAANLAAPLVAGVAPVRAGHITMSDGVRLFIRHFEAPRSLRRPVVCLAGLTRNGRDFDELAQALSNPTGHRRSVITIDARGRGLSDYDPNWKNYNVLVEAADILDVLTAFDLHKPALIATSRGGILAMVAAVMRPAALGPVVLNDIGPVIEEQGIARIAAYAGRLPTPGSWDEAARLCRDLSRHQFPDLDDEAWMGQARKTFNDAGGRPAAGCDKAISRQIAAAGGAIPKLWPQFMALSHVPAMAIRGANSDILSVETLVEMQRRHPNLRALTVPNQGHAPLLTVVKPR